MKRLHVLWLMGILCLLGSRPLVSQEITQTVRGTVSDSETLQPLVAATVAVYQDSTVVSASITDMDGRFRIPAVPVGRYTLAISYVGYRQLTVPDIQVNSAKEVILPLTLDEAPVEIGEIQVRASGQKGQALNKLAFTSARAFSVEESERYAGSRADPARMASNFAGVQGNDDSNNDLVIRGNSPLGVLWRLEGVNIPNPNHFAVCGTTGGPVTILNNKVLALSDFMTGAFPAEFGNSNAGVFDLKLRNGNNEQHEFSGQLGFLGTELTAEGPLSRKNRSSYLAAYRYSTMQIFQTLGIEIGTDAVPRYQDLSFKFNFPGKSGNLSLFGMGGKSAVDILASEQLTPDPNSVYGDQAMDEHFRTGMGVLGLNYSRSTGDRSYCRLTVAVSREHQSNRHDKVYRHLSDGQFEIDTVHTSFMGYRSDQDKYSASYFWNCKVNSRHSLKVGVITDLYGFRMDDSLFNESSLDHTTRLDHRGVAFLAQPYAQWKYNHSGDLTLTGGVHGQLLELETNRSMALEPRFGLSYRTGEGGVLGFGMGLHSQMLPAYIYLAQVPGSNGIAVQPNLGLDFIRSFHSVVSWSRHLQSDLRIKLESYYQHLFNVPVELRSSSYSVLDEGHNLSRFFPDSLINQGTGRNVGLECTLEKFFSRDYFLLVTGSLYDAKRTGSDGLRYNAVFDGGYIVNILGAREIRWGVDTRNRLTVGGKICLAGGKRYTPIDLNASADAGEAVYQDPLRNTGQFRPYFRADLKINYRINARRLAHEIGLDVVNLTDRRNILKQIYISGAEPPVQEVYQLGILPLFYYRIDF